MLPSLEEQRIAPARVVVRVMIYHAVRDSQPTSVEIGRTRLLSSDEQPYCRRITVTEEWKPLETGWLEGKCSLLMLVNREGESLRVIPSEEQKVDIASKVVEVGCNGCANAVFLVQPSGHPFIATPKALDNLRVRCQKGTAKCDLSVFPE